MAARQANRMARCLNDMHRSGIDFLSTPDGERMVNFMEDYFCNDITEEELECTEREGLPSSRGEELIREESAREEELEGSAFEEQWVPNGMNTWRTLLSLKKIYRL